jgi:dipeptidyl-peptidase-4
MKRFIFILLAFAFFPSFVNAQSAKKQLSVSDATIGIYMKSYYRSIHNFQWIDNTTYTYRKGTSLMKGSVKSKKETTYLSVDDLKTITKDTNIKQFPSYKWLSKTTLRITAQSDIYTLDIAKKKVLNHITLPDEADHTFASPDYKAMAYTKDNNLFFMDNDGKEIQITNDEKGIVNGDIVARNEFGIDHGIFWSPKSDAIAFYHKDERPVTDYPLVDITSRIASVEPTKYPMAGMHNEKEQVGVYNLKTGKTIFLKTDTSKDQFLPSVTWSPDGNYIFIAVLNREQNHMWLNQYDAHSGAFVKTLFEETNDTYVEPLFPLYFLKTKPNEFLWLSRRDGWMHFYRYNTDGKLIKQLTKGEWEVTEFIGLDNGDKNLFFMATKDSPLENRLYKLNMASGTITTVTSVAGTHSVRPNNAFSYFLDAYSNTSITREYLLVDANGKTKKSLLLINDLLKDYDMPTMKLSTIKAADKKTTLYTRLILPPHMDSTKQYPVLIYVYGGPHAQLITNSWLGGASLWLYYMAQQGYIVFTVDNRGSANRGFAFENVIHRQLGKHEMEDQMEGVKYLSSLPYVDTSKIGVDGWSFGGFMTISLMLNYPKVFKVGVAGGPVIDWKYYEVMYGERYMDMPQENPEGYQSVSLLNDEKIKTLSGRKLMIIHGAVDKTVVWQNSLSFIRKCVENRVPVDYFVYPRAEHNVHGYDRIHLNQKIATYFDDYLKK